MARKMNAPETVPDNSMNPPFAYENTDFLRSPDARIFRIMAEYQEPLARFRRERIEDTVVFFGSARFQALDAATSELELLANTGSTQPAPEPEQPARQNERESGDVSAHKLRLAEAAVDMAAYYEDARRLARMVAGWAKSLPGDQHRFVVTTGGGPGIMEAANRGAFEAGAKSIGLNIRLPFEQQSNAYVTPELNFTFHYFFMRKFWFAYLAKALVIFPGGFGTLDEMSEILTLAQTHKLAKQITIVIYGSSYWKSVINFDEMADRGTVALKDLELLRFADTPEEAFAILKDSLTEHHLRSSADAASVAFIDTDQASVPAGPRPSAEAILGPDIARTR